MARIDGESLDEAERETLNEQTLTVLEEVGVAYNTPAAMDLLEGTGAGSTASASGAAAAGAGRALPGDDAAAGAARRPRPGPRRVAG